MCPYIFRFPFDWHSPVNYIYYQISWFVFRQAAFSIYCCSTTFYIGTCRFIVAFCVDLEEMINKCNQWIIKSQSKKPLPTEDYLKLKKMLADLIQFQSDVRQLSTYYEFDSYKRWYWIKNWTQFCCNRPLMLRTNRRKMTLRSRLDARLELSVTDDWKFE